MCAELEAIEVGATLVREALPEMVAATERLFAETHGQPAAAVKFFSDTARKMWADVPQRINIPVIKRFCGEHMFAVEQRLPLSTEASIFQKNRDAIVRIAGSAPDVKDLGSITRIIPGGHRGSGFLLKGDLVATNYHVVSGNKEAAQIFLRDGTELAGKLVARDKVADLAVLKIIGKPPSLSLPSVELATKGTGLRRNALFFIGHPNGVTEATMGEGKFVALKNYTAEDALAMRNSVFSKNYERMKILFDKSHPSWTDPGVSSIRNAGAVEIDTTIPAMPGASGSPLFDAEGKVRGVISRGSFSITSAAHVDHLHVLLKEIPMRQVEDAWLDIASKPLTYTAADARVSVSATRMTEVPWQKTFGVWSNKIQRLIELKLIDPRG